LRFFIASARELAVGPPPIDGPDAGADLRFGPPADGVALTFGAPAGAALRLGPPPAGVALRLGPPEDDAAGVDPPIFGPPPGGDALKFGPPEGAAAGEDGVLAGEALRLGPLPTEEPAAGVDGPERFAGPPAGEALRLGPLLIDGPAAGVEAPLVGIAGPAVGRFVAPIPLLIRNLDVSIVPGGASINRSTSVSKVSSADVNLRSIPVNCVEYDSLVSAILEPIRLMSKANFLISLRSSVSETTLEMKSSISSSLSDMIGHLDIVHSD